MKNVHSLLLFCLLIGFKPAFCQFPNVMIGNQNAPEEVSLIINPKNPMQMAAGANLDNYYFSTDWGQHWTGRTIKSAINGVYGDPVLTADTAGAFYFLHLSNPPAGAGSWVDRIVIQRSTDGGITYSDGAGIGKNGTKVQDKPWPAINPFTNEVYVTWTQFDEYGTRNPADSSNILFSKSKDNAVTWSTPKRINRQAGDCIDSDSTVEGAVPCIGPNGQIYVAWAGPLGLTFNKSTDDGDTWMPAEKVINTIPGGWDYPVKGMFRCNGMPVTACDLSKGSNRGTIYVNWSDQRNGLNDADIWLVKSTDEGQHWTEPKRVNSDAPGNQNYMSWMTVDQVNGDLYVVYYDRRNHKGNDSTDVYVSRSTDGGNTFKDYRINEKSFSPDTAVFFGDYIDISAVGGIVRPIWMQYDGKGLSIWTALIEPGMVGRRETFLRDQREDTMDEPVEEVK